jgi:hypothetical protein
MLPPVGQSLASASGEEPAERYPARDLMTDLYQFV